jgi:hypothetical protein
VELIKQTVLRQLVADLLDAFGDDQDRPVTLFRQEVPHGPSQRTGHPDLSSHAMQERELPVDLTNLFCLPAAQSLNGFLDRHIEDQIAIRIQQIDQAFNRRVGKSRSGGQRRCRIHGIVSKPAPVVNQPVKADFTHKRAAVKRPPVTDP